MRSENMTLTFRSEQSGLASRLVEGSVWALQRAELYHVAPEEQRDGPVQDDADFPVERGDPADMVAAMEEPRRKAPHPDPEDPRNALVPAKGNEASQVLVAERLEFAAVKGCSQVLRQPAGLAEGVLSGRWGGSTGRQIRYRGAVAGSPGGGHPPHAEELIGPDSPPFVQRKTESPDKRIGADAGRPYERLRLEGLAVRQAHPAFLGRIEARVQVNLDSAM